jgi:hypothetical protein
MINAIASRVMRVRQTSIGRHLIRVNLIQPEIWLALAAVGRPTNKQVIRLLNSFFDITHLNSQILSMTKAIYENLGSFSTVRILTVELNLAQGAGRIKDHCHWNLKITGRVKRQASIIRLDILSRQFWAPCFLVCGTNGWPISRGEQRSLRIRASTIKLFLINLVLSRGTFWTDALHRPQMDNARNRFFKKVSTLKILQNLYIRNGLESLENARVNKRESIRSIASPRLYWLWGGRLAPPSGSHIP